MARALRRCYHFAIAKATGKLDSRDGHRTQALVVAVFVLAAMLIFAAGAQAFSVSGGVARPQSTQQGAHSPFHLHIDISADDDLHDLTFELPPGQTLYPGAQPACPESQLSSDSCPTDTQVADASAQGTAGGFTVTAPAAIYNVVPQPGEPGRLGVVLRPPILPKVTQIATLSQRPDSGFNIALANIPNQDGGTHVHIDNIDALFTAAFVSNPTTCSPATTRFVATSYSNPTSQVTTSDSYTPTGCAPPPPPPPTQKCKVPNVLRKKLAGAKAAIRAAHCAVGTVTRKESSNRNIGRVIHQSPAAGKQFAVGKKVNLTVGK